MQNRSKPTRSSLRPIRKAVAPLIRSMGVGFEPLEGRRLMAAISVSAGEPVYTQSFSGDSIPSGWLIKETGTSGNVNQQAGIGTGSSNAGDVYLFGSSSSDRAYGTLLSGTITPTIGAVFRNDSGQPITSATIKYNGEMWRLGETGGSDSLQFSFRVASGAEPADPTVGTYTSVAGLNFSTPNSTGTAGARNGNTAPYRTDNITAALPSLAWGAGEYLVIRWTDENVSGSDDGLAVDDFSLTVDGLETGGPGTLVLTPSSLSVNESAGTVTFTVDRVGGTVGTVSADVLLTAGTAGASDYGPASAATVTFADGDDASQTFTVPIIDDNLYEIAEQFAVSLTNPQGTGGAPELVANSTVTINTDSSEIPFFKESFESAPGTTYTLEGPLTSTETFNYFGRFSAPDLTNGARDDFTGGFDQSWAIQGQNHSGIGFGDEGDPTRTVAIPDIDITGRENLSAFFSLGALASEPTHMDWTLTDGISIFATIDGGARTLIGQFKPDNTVGDLQLDSDLDGQGDGVTLRQGTLQDFAFAIPGTGSSLTIEVDVTTTDNFQSWALDNVRVDGAAVETGLPAWVAAGSLATWDALTGTLTVTGATTIIADPGVDVPTIVADGASAVVTFDPTNDLVITLGGINLTGGASAVVQSVSSRTATNHITVVVDGSAFSIDASSSFDLRDNDMVVKNGNVAGIESLIAAARDVAGGGTWTGTSGLTSAVAQSAFNDNGFEVNSLAAVRNGDNLLGAYGTFNGVDVGDDDILIKFTYVGDITLDGRIDGDDEVIFNGFYGSGTRWFEGDITGDGIVDGNDEVFFNGFYGYGTDGNPFTQL